MECPRCRSNLCCSLILKNLPVHLSHKTFITWIICQLSFANGHETVQKHPEIKFLRTYVIMCSSCSADWKRFFSLFVFRSSRLEFLWKRCLPKFCKIQRKTVVHGSLFRKVGQLQPATLFINKNTPLVFAKFLAAAFFAELL